MWTESRHFRLIGLYLAMAMFLIGAVPADVLAGWTPSSAIQENGVAGRTNDLQTIRQIIESKAVADRLTDLGYTREEVASRLSQLDDASLQELALDLDSLQTGSDSVLSVIIALLVIAILVVVLLQLTGHKVIIQ